MAVTHTAPVPSLDGPTTGPARRERRRQRVRDEIAAAAMRLAVERGYDRITVDDIAAEVDIAPRTFFRYFACKDDVLFTDHSERLDQLRRAIGARPADEPVLASVRHAVLSLADTFEHDGELAFAKAKLIAETPTLTARADERQAEWRQVIAEAVSARLGVDADGDLRAQLVAGATVAAVQAAFRVWLAGGATRHLPELVAEALDLLDGGLLEPARPALSRRATRQH